MQLIRFILREERSGWRTLVVMLLLMSAPFGLVGLVIGGRIAAIGEEAPGFNLVATFLILAAANVWMNGLVVTRIIGHVESMSYRLRARILARARRLELTDFERIGRSEIYYSLATNTRRISDGTVVLGRAGINLFGTIGCLVLIAWLSLQALMVVLLAFVAVGIVYVANQMEITRTSAAARRHEFGFFRGVESLVRGFKEIKLHKAKDDAFFEAEIIRLGEAYEAARGRAGIRLLLNYLLYIVLVMLAVGALLYLLPVVSPHLSDVAAQAALIAGLIPLSVLRDLPVVTRAAGALDRLTELEAELAAATASADAAPAAPFRSLALRDIEFHYTDKDGEPSFSVGPISFEVPTGSICFLVGGNGSGKSTLLKILTGLYPAHVGSVLVNGSPVLHGVQRSLFSSVFFEPHLFPILYGYRGVPPEEVRGWLRTLDLDDRVGYAGGRFTDLKLSTGQRKRLAMVTALVEDRPVLAFDEWAAEQDPEHRRWFYLELLPALKTRGRTVIAVTHDDRYFHVADQVIRLEAGRMLPPAVTPPACGDGRQDRL